MSDEDAAEDAFYLSGFSPSISAAGAAESWSVSLTHGILGIGVK